MSVWALSVFIAALAVLVGADRSRAEELVDQEVFVAAPAAESSTAAPDVYYLPDGKGGLRRVVGFQFDDFVRAWEIVIAQQRQAAPPRAAIQRLTIDGTQRDDGLYVEALVEVGLLADGWVNVPLGLAGLIVNDAEFLPTDAADDQREDALVASRPTVVRDPATKGLVLWISGEDGDRTTVAVHGILPLANTGDQRSATLDLPQAGATKMQLEVDGRDLEIGGAEVGRIVLKPRRNGRDAALVEGAAGRLRMTWRDDDQGAEGPTNSIAATGEIAIDVAADRTAYAATYHLETFGRAIDRVQIELPRGAVMTGRGVFADGRPVDYAMVRPEPGGAGASRTSRDANVVEFRFPEALADPPALQFTAEAAHQATIDRTTRRIVGPRVLGAFREHGAASVTISKQLQAYFDFAGGIDQIARSDLPSSLRANATSAAFTYVGADWSIAMTTAPQERRVRVVPAYDLQVRNQQVELSLQLEYQVMGGQLFELQLDLNGWDLADVPIESGGLIDRAGVNQTSPNRLRLRLRDAANETLRVQLTLRRRTALGINALPLPTPLDALVLPGRLTLSSSPELRATPLLQQLVGMSRSSISSAATTDGAQRPAFDTFSGDLEFAVEVSERQQEVDVDVETVVDLRPEESLVRQVFRYDVKYQPLETAHFSIPTELWDQNDLIWEINGEPVGRPQVLTESVLNSGGERNKTVVALAFPSSVIGKADIVVQRPLTAPPSTPAEDAALLIDLAMPVESVRKMEAIVTTAPQRPVSLAVGGDAMGWTPGIDDAPRRGQLRLIGNGNVDQLPMRVLVAEPVVEKPLKLNKVWIQTWLAAGQRLDRTAYQIQTDRDQIELQLPETFQGRGNEFEVIVDGKPVEIVREGVVRDGVEHGGGQTITAPLTPKAAAGPDQISEHTVEIRHQSSFAAAQWKSVAARVPQIVGVDLIATTYWQLVVPNAFAVVTTPARMSSEYELGWKNYRWGRQANQNDDDLESWIGAMNRRGPSPAANQYLYSAFATPQQMQVVMIRRGWLTAGTGVVLLLLTGVLVNTSLARRPEAWLAAALTVLIVAFTYPETASILLVGLGVAGLAALVIGAIRLAMPSARRRATVGAPMPTSIQTAATDLWPPQLSSREPLSGATEEPVTTSGGQS